jgi:hypothetical protein
VNLDELYDAMSASDPDPRGVLAEFERKRRRGRQRMLAASGGMAVVIVLAVVVGAIVHGLSGGTPDAGMSSSAPAPAIQGPLPNGAAGAGSGGVPKGGPQRNSGVVPSPSDQFSASSGASAADTCVATPLKDAIASAVRQGASVIVATGTLTGKSVTGNPVTAGSAAFYAMTLSSVQTLRGPVIASGSTVWIPGPAPGTPASVTNPLLAPGGRLFAIVSPKAVTRYLIGPTLRLAPVVGGDVVFTPYGCWDVAGLQPSQYQANTRLRSVPGGVAFGGANQPAENGLYAVPLATVEQIAAKA